MLLSVNVPDLYKAGKSLFVFIGWMLGNGAHKLNGNTKVKDKRKMKQSGMLTNTRKRKINKFERDFFFFFN
jgi:hypothetical protein